MTPSLGRYLSVDEVWTINALILGREGQSATLLNRSVLGGALMRPQTAAHYEQADLAMQAALLITAIALAHAFLDGNKRTALVAGVVFLDLNGFVMDVPPSDDAFGRRVEALVADHARQDEAVQRFYGWLRLHVMPKP